jgi:hypothetical protein
MIKSNARMMMNCELRWIGEENSQKPVSAHVQFGMRSIQHMSKNQVH